MEDLGAKLLVSIGVISLILLLGTISGSILWLIYPHIHSLFPTAAENGIIAKTLGWWDSVCIVWIFSILIKSSNTIKGKE